MNVIENFLNRISYKFSKGYPDLENVNDIILLETIFKNMGIKLNLKEGKKPFDFLSGEAKNVATNISKQLNIPLENIKSHSKNRIILLHDDRNNVFNQLENMGFERDPNIIGSSQGGLRNTEGIEIIIKPLSQQGARSAGKQNEVSFNNLINSHIETNKGPINVIFKSQDKNLKYNNVASCVDSSTALVTDYIKSDSELLDSSNNLIVGISLKKRNAIRWESSKGRTIKGVNLFKNFISKIGIYNTEKQGEFGNLVLYPIEGKTNKFKLYDSEKEQIISKVVVKNTPSEMTEKVVFGEDSNTIVIKETFENFKNYSFENGVLTINCYKIYTSSEDLINTEDEPVFAFSNHSGQAFGIEFRSFTKGALYKNGQLKGSGLELDFSQLI